MRVFRSLFLLMIATIVLVHSLVPHEHHDKSESEICITNAQDESNDIFDWIALGLHMNQSEGHLEHFLKNQKTTLSFDVVAIPCSLHPISFAIPLKEITPLNLSDFIQNDCPLASQYCQPQGLRAPPFA